MSDQAVLYAALQTKTGAELLNEVVTERQLRFMMRVKKGQPTAIWLNVIDHIIALGDKQVASGSPAWTIDISKQYFRRPELKYGWRIILQSSNIKGTCLELAASIANVSQHAGQQHEITEVQLHGSPSRKSGGYTGTVAVGHLAVRT